MPKTRMERTDYGLIADGVHEHEQTLGAMNPFWVFLIANLGLGTWLMGVLVAGMGLGFEDAIFVLLIGSIVGSVLPGLLAMAGPKTRLSQMEYGRFALGRGGKKLPAFLNWFGAIGWDAANNMFSAAALVAFLGVYHVVMPFWLALGILVALQLLIGAYGHHLIQETSKYTAVLFALFFVVIGVIAMRKTGLPQPPASPATAKEIIAALALLIANNAGGWAPFASDYTRYMPAHTPGRVIFAAVFAALFLTLFMLSFFGYMTASSVAAQSPQGVMDALQSLTGRFAPLVLLLVAVNSIPVNAINDNSAAYSLMSAGVKISRLTAALIGGSLGFVICLLASDAFFEVFENFLFLLIHWIAPWSAILLVHWYAVGKREQKTPSGYTRGSLIFVAVTALSVGLFSANTLYTGLLASEFGGMDIGPYLGFVAAGAIYYASLKLWPQKFRKA